MTIHPKNEQVPSGSSLLTAQEQAICNQIATRDAPHSQRALALLALTEKSTQAQAAQKAGLSIGQVRYWTAKFRKQRLGIFPDILLEEPKAEAGAAPLSEIEEAETITEKADPAEDKQVETKAKKGKKTKNDKKSKKSKKTKKVSKKTKKAKKGKKSKKTKKTTGKTKKDKKGKKGKKTKKPTGKTKKDKKGKKSKKTK